MREREREKEGDMRDSMRENEAGRRREGDACVCEIGVHAYACVTEIARQKTKQRSTQDREARVKVRGEEGQC